MRTLLVEDSAHGIAFAERLNGLGYPCDHVRSQVECLRNCRRQPYDAIFLDLETPDLEGEELLRIVRGEFPEIQVILLSALDEQDLIERLLAMGATAYVMKPVASETLSGVVAALSSIIDAPPHRPASVAP
jgi:CheY-like chemotaxis protein